MSFFVFLKNTGKTAVDILTIIIIILFSAAALIYAFNYLAKKSVLPKVIYKSADGAVTGKCPERGAVIQFTKSESKKNLYTFKCDKCGAESKTTDDKYEN